jgi:hypothetical protein
MKEKENHDVYNHPGGETEQQERPTNKEGNKVEQKIAANPNPKANENIKNRDIYTDENDGASQAGSEITDGEDG